MIQEMKYKVKQKKVSRNQVENNNNSKHFLTEKLRNQKKQKLKALANYRNQKYKQYCKNNKMNSASERVTRVRAETICEKQARIDAWNVNQTDY